MHPTHFLVFPFPVTQCLILITTKNWARGQTSHSDLLNAFRQYVSNKFLIVLKYIRSRESRSASIKLNFWRYFLKWCSLCSAENWFFKADLDSWDLKDFQNIGTYIKNYSKYIVWTHPRGHCADSCLLYFPSKIFLKSIYYL